MGRNFGLARKNSLLRPDLARAKLLLSLVHTTQIIVTLLTLLALYGWMAARDAQAAAEDQQSHAERLLTSYMNHGAVEDETTIYTCAAKAYEVPR